MNEDDRTAVIEVPFSSLKPTTLRALIEEFVTRDTTDYGLPERTLDEKVEDVMRQLRQGDARVVFVAETDSVNIVTRKR